MVDLCPVVKWSGIQMVVWKPDWKKPVYGPKCLVFEWCAKSHDFTIWIADTHTVLYSDESSIRVLGIQMVTVLLFGKWHPSSSEWKLDCRAEIHQALPSQFYLLADILIWKVSVKD